MREINARGSTGGVAVRVCAGVFALLLMSACAIRGIMLSKCISLQITHSRGV